MKKQILLLVQLSLFFWEHSAAFLITAPPHNNHIQRGGAFLRYSTTSKNNNNDNDDGLSIGFVGCGTIAAAIATGLATQTDHAIASIAVSERSQAKSSKLLEQFPELVTIHSDNQEIVDQADLIFICVLPAQVSEVLQSLAFDSERHTLVSLVVSCPSEFCCCCCCYNWFFLCSL